MLDSVVYVLTLLAWHGQLVGLWGICSAPSLETAQFTYAPAALVGCRCFFMGTLSGNTAL